MVPLPEGRDVLTDLLRDGAGRLLAEAIEAEVAALAHLKNASGRQQVVRNGHPPELAIQTGIGRPRPRSPGSVTAGPPHSGRRSPPPFCPRTCGGPGAWRS
jgi:hypothetical protein